MPKVQARCSTCDHKIIEGVACDGPCAICPVQAAVDHAQHKMDEFSTIIDEMTDIKDQDAVKSMD